MLSLKQYSKKEVDSILRKNGFTYQRANGSHKIYCKGGKIHISVPLGNDPNKMIIHRLIKSYKLCV